MHSVLIAFLIVVFSGVHTAAAFDAGHLDLNGIKQMTVENEGQVAQGNEDRSHQMKCCENIGEEGSESQLSKCGADCVSFVISSADPLSVTPATPESHRTPSLSALPVLSQDHPPKRV